MNELIKVTKNKNGEQVVSARELHSFLEVSKPITQWFEYQVERAMLIENEDFITILLESTGGRPSKDYAIKLSASKELAMLNGGEKGKKARKYFIECEKIAKDLLEINPPKKLPQTYSEALRELADVTEAKILLEQRNEKLEPRSAYFEQMIMTDGLISMEQASKLLNIKDMGRNKLFKALRNGNVIQKNNTSPKQYYIEKGYFELKEEIILVNKIRKVIVTTYVTQKGLAFLFKFFGLTTKNPTFQ